RPVRQALRGPGQGQGSQGLSANRLSGFWPRMVRFDYEYSRGFLRAGGRIRESANGNGWNDRSESWNQCARRHQDAPRSRELDRRPQSDLPSIEREGNREWVAPSAPQ